MVINLVCVAAGGATGAVLRYLSVLAATRLFGAGFPFGTLFVNVTGSFLIGIAAALVLRHPALIGTFYGPLLVTGVLGGFTTFSAYSLDAMTMIEGGAIHCWRFLCSRLCRAVVARGLRRICTGTGSVGVMPVRRLEIGRDEAGLRLDRWIRNRFPGTGQGLIEKLLRRGEIRVDGARAKASTRLVAGQQVRLPPAVADQAVDIEGARRTPPPPMAELEALRERIVFQDDWFVVIDKPAGLAVQGGVGQQRHVDAYLPHLLRDDGPELRLVHRLDKETSGLLVLAASRKAAASFSEMLRARAVTKTYYAICHGMPQVDAGRIDTPLGGTTGATGFDPARNGDSGLLDALTEFQVCASNNGQKFSLLALKPITGRKHQLRRHLAEIGCPILGDDKYGPRSKVAAPTSVPCRSLCLHAGNLSFRHPGSGKRLDLAAEPPPSFRATLGQLSLPFVPEVVRDQS